MNTKIIKINSEFIEFDNGYKLLSEHDQDCCEQHYLYFNDLDIEDTKNLEFDLNNENFFEKLEGYGIGLKPILGFPIRIPGYGSNNGHYSTNLTLLLTDKNNKMIKSYDISECQEIND